MSAVLKPIADAQTPERPKALLVLPETIPDALRSMATWVVWRYQLNDTKKWTKVPYQCNRNRKASTTNAQTWASFDTAFAAYERGNYDGIGLVLTDDIAGIDLDHVYSDGEIKAWARPVLDRFHGTYVEHSPGGEGLRIFCRGKVAHSGKAGPNNNLEVYDKKSPRYLTVTGHRLSDAGAVISMQPALDWLHEEFFAEKPNGEKHAEPGEPRTDDDAVIERARTAKNGEKFAALFAGDTSPHSGDDSATDMALCCILAFWTRDAAQIDRIFRRSSLMRDKWDERRRDSTYGADTVMNALGTVTETYSGATKSGTSLEDFHAYMPDHRYLYVPTGDLWPASSVDSRCAWPKDADDKPFAPHKWLDQHRAIEQMTWSPGEPQLIVDRVVQGGGWIQKPGGKVFNLYRPPTLIPGDCHGASRWRDHLRAIYPDDADHIERWFAQRIQHPEIKLNHALVLGGAQGIGKDSLCEPVKQAVGPWNWCDISPTTMIGRFNGWTKAVIVRVSEARDLGDVNRFAFYEHSKTYIAAPPDVLRVDEKNCREYPIVNAIGLLITTNYKCDGIYLPPDDRRHYIAWSDITREAFDDAYWREFWGWLQAGGINAVAAFLRSLDLSNFDPKAPPTKTEAFYAIVQANANPEESELADLIDRIGMPTVLTLELLADSSHASMEFKQQLTDRTKRRTWPHRMERVGYVPIRNAAAPSDGAWKVNRRRQVVYARRELTVSDRLLQVQKFVATGRVSSV